MSQIPRQPAKTAAQPVLPADVDLWGHIFDATLNSFATLFFVPFFLAVINHIPQPCAVGQFLDLCELHSRNKFSVEAKQFRFICVMKVFA